MNLSVGVCLQVPTPRLRAIQVGQARLGGNRVGLANEDGMPWKRNLLKTVWSCIIEIQP